MGFDRVVLFEDQFNFNLDANKFDVNRYHEIRDQNEATLDLSLDTQSPRTRPLSPAHPDQETRWPQAGPLTRGQDLPIPSTHEPQQHNVDAIGLAYRWRDEFLKNRETVSALARRYGVTGPFVHRRLRLIQLSPAVLCNSLNRTLALNTTLEDLTEAAKHLDWDHQAQYLGLDKPREIVLSNLGPRPAALEPASQFCHPFGWTAQVIWNRRNRPE